MNLARKRKAITAAVAGAAIAASLLAACSPTSKVAQPYDDAPVSGHLTGPAEVVNMPDGFSNFADKCDGHGHRVYVAFHGDSAYGAITAISDPTCPGGSTAPAK